MTALARVFVGIAALAAASLLTACATGGRGQPAVLEGTTWRIVQVDGAEVRRTDDLNMAPHLRILSAEGQVHGATGCNRFSGRYMADGTSVRFGPLATTRMACVDGSLAAQESRILDVLNATDGYRIDGRWLWLMVGGQHRMTLEVW
jgi:heat shock protein HslJ